MVKHDQSKKRLAPLGVRIPPDLKRKIKIAAAQEDRTMNAQIVRHLREIYGTDGEGDAA